MKLPFEALRILEDGKQANALELFDCDGTGSILPYFFFAFAPTCAYNLNLGFTPVFEQLKGKFRIDHQFLPRRLFSIRFACLDQMNKKAVPSSRSYVVRLLAATFNGSNNKELRW